MPQPYQLDKKIWTENDFSIMGWHDSPVYGMLFQSDISILSNHLLFDLDYIFQWVDPVPPDEYFHFWIAPVTLIFRDVINLNIEMKHEPPDVFDFEILDIYQLEKCTYPYGQPYWKWQIELTNGNIYFNASGYEQIVRKPPVFTTSQEYPDRGECNFSRITF